MLFHSEHRFALIWTTVKQNIKIRNKNKCTYDLLKEIKIIMAIFEENIWRGTKFLIVKRILFASHRIHCQTKLFAFPVPPVLFPQLFFFLPPFLNLFYSIFQLYVSIQSFPIPLYHLPPHSPHSAKSNSKLVPKISRHWCLPTLWFYPHGCGLDLWTQWAHCPLIRLGNMAKGD